MLGRHDKIEAFAGRSKHAFIDASVPVTRKLERMHVRVTACIAEHLHLADDFQSDRCALAASNLYPGGWSTVLEASRGIDPVFTLGNTDLGSAVGRVNNACADGLRSASS